MPIPEKLLDQKAAILADSVDGLFSGVRALESKVMLQVIPRLNGLNTKDGKLQATPSNYTLADVSMIVRSAIDSDLHREFAKTIVANLREARRLATEASLKMDKAFVESPDAEIIIQEGAKAIVRNLSPEVMGAIIGAQITNRIVIAISLGQTVEELTNSLMRDVER